MMETCPWCGELFRDDYDGYKEHVELHAFIGMLNGEAARCPLCTDVMLTTFEAWEKHWQRYHENKDAVLHVCLPSPAKVAKLCDKQKGDSTSNFPRVPSPGPILSPVEGPSEVHQTGYGDGEANVNEMFYSFREVRQKTFKNGVIDRHYRVKFNPEQSLEGRKLSTMHNQLQNMFDDVISQATAHLRGSDLCRVVVHHPSLTNSVYYPLKKVDKASGQDILQHFENVLNSHQSLEMNEGFSVDVGTMELPGGGTRLPIDCLVGDDNSLHKKRSIIQIKNTDNNCLARAIGVAFAAANTVSLSEWKERTKNDKNLSVDQMVLKYKKCPVWYKKTVAQQSNRQNELAVSLCREAGLPINKFLTINDISHFEELLCVDIIVVSS